MGSFSFFHFLEQELNILGLSTTPHARDTCQRKKGGLRIKPALAMPFASFGADDRKLTEDSVNS